MEKDTRYRKRRYEEQVCRRLDYCGAAVIVCEFENACAPRYVKPSAGYSYLSGPSASCDAWIVTRELSCSKRTTRRKRLRIGSLLGETLARRCAIRPRIVDQRYLLGIISADARCGIRCVPVTVAISHTHTGEPCVTGVAFARLNRSLPVVSLLSFRSYVTHFAFDKRQNSQ